MLCATPRFYPFLLAAALVLPSQAFLLPAAPSSTSKTAREAAVDPQVLASNLPAIQMSVVAAASAMAGAMSQQPRIQELEHELALAKEAIDETRAAGEAKLVLLEDKLFEMDKEYEAQTDRFKRRYDTDMKKKLEAMRAKLEVDYQYKLEIALGDQKSKRLMQEFDTSGRVVEKEAQLSQVRIEQQRLTSMNHQLEDALASAADELEKLKKTASKKFLGLF